MIRKICKIAFCTLFIIINYTFSIAQNHYFKSYNVSSGLSHQTVYCSLQDYHGFVWFGTRDGLNRFDGYKFKNFKNLNKKDPLLSTLVIDIFQDYKNKIWVGTNKGLYIYNENLEDFTLVEETSKKRISSITQDWKNNIWFIGDSSLCVLKNNKYLEYPQSSVSRPSAIIKTFNDNLWISTEKGVLLKLNEVKNSFTKFNILENEKSSLKRISTLAETKNGNLLIGTSHLGLKLFDVHNNKLKSIINNNQDNTNIFVRDILRYNDEEYWCATESGIYIYNIVTGSLEHLKTEINNPYAISDNSVYTLTKDLEGGVWVGTYFGGINYYPANYNLFTKFYETGKKESLVGNIIRDICEDKNGLIWIGTEDAGINIYNPQNNVFTNLSPNKSSISIANNNIHGLLAIDNEMWVGTFEHGLDRIDINSKKIIKHYNAGLGALDLKSNFITTIYKTNEGEILIGTSNGLYKYVKEFDGFELLKQVSKNSFVYSILQDNSGIIYVGTLGEGVTYFNPKNGESKRYINNNGNNGIAGNKIYGIFEDSNYNIWFCTENNGISVIDYSRKNFKHYTIKDGLPSNHTFKVLEDENKNIWVTTYEGLSLLDKKTNKFDYFTKANGLLSNQFNYNSGFKDKNGDFYLGTLKGLIKFNPTAFQKTNYTPSLYITGFQIYNNEVKIGKNDPLQKSIIDSKEINLKFDQSTFSIDFAALSFSSPENTSYSYILEGLENNWTQIKSNRRVYFTNLKPGTYFFKVKTTSSANPDKSTANLKIIVSPPWWTSNLAITLYLILLSVASYFLYKFISERHKLIQQRKLDLLSNKIEKEIYEAKIEFFTSIAHEIRTPLTLIKGPLEIMHKAKSLDEAKENALMIEKNTDRLLSLTNQLLDFRRIETNVYTLSFIHTNIVPFLKEIIERFEGALSAKKITLNIDIPQESLFAYVDREALTKILSNLLNNALKYGDHQITIKLFKDDISNEFLVTVRNDGEVVPEKFVTKIFEPFFRIQKNDNKMGTGIGLPLASKLAELHKGLLTFSNADDLNSFTLKLPINQANSFDLELEDEETELISNDEVNDKSNINILLVDDNLEIANFIIKALGKKYNYYTAINGKTALKRLNENRIDLIISDVMMPVMDGFEFCKIVKSEFEYSHIPLILLTAKDSLKSKIEGTEIGADSYIQKPFSPEYLEVKIQNLITNRNSLKNYYATSPNASLKSIAHSKADEIFLEKLNEIIQVNLSDSEFGIDQIAEKVNMSRPTLFRKIKAISDLKPNELINVARIKKAAELLSEEKYKVYEVSFMVGFNSSTVFSRVFQRHFSISPTEYLNKQWKSNKG